MLIESRGRIFHSVGDFSPGRHLPMAVGNHALAGIGANINPHEIYFISHNSPFRVMTGRKVRQRQYFSCIPSRYPLFPLPALSPHNY